MAAAKKPLTPEQRQRKRNVERVLDAEKRLAQVEQALADAVARIPSIMRLVTEAREAIREATAPVKRDNGDDEKPEQPTLPVPEPEEEDDDAEHARPEDARD